MDKLWVTTEELTVGDKFDQFGLTCEVYKILLGEISATIFGHIMIDGRKERVMFACKKNFPVEIYQQIDSDLELSYLLS